MKEYIDAYNKHKELDGLINDYLKVGGWNSVLKSVKWQVIDPKKDILFDVKLSGLSYPETPFIFAQIKEAETGELVSEHVIRFEQLPIK